jgi:hypothetical protein
MMRKIGISGMIALLSIFPMLLGRFLFYFYFGPPENIGDLLVNPVTDLRIEMWFFSLPLVVFLITLVIQLKRE